MITIVNREELRAIIARNGLSQRKVAAMIGISEKTFYEKMKKRKFGSDEMEAMISILHIEDPISIFFSSDCSLLSDNK